MLPQYLEEFLPKEGALESSQESPRREVATSGPRQASAQRNT
jgi:hypothetical protein